MSRLATTACLTCRASLIPTTEKPSTMKKNAKSSNTSACKAKETCPLQSLAYRVQVPNDPDNNDTNYTLDVQDTLSMIAFTSIKTYSATEIIHYRALKIYLLSTGQKYQQYRNEEIVNPRQRARLSKRLKKCELCLTEKLHILFQKYHLLNKRNELLSSCCYIKPGSHDGISKRAKQKATVKPAT